MDNFRLRPYQIEALNAISARFKTGRIALLSAATGAGKTALTCRMVNKYYFNSQKNFLVLAHKQELLQQFHGTFTNITDIPKADIDYCCSGIQKNTNFDCRVMLASVQTLINRLNEYPGADLIIVDETHRISHDQDTQYQQLLSELMERRQNCRVLGITATVYRLGHGHIYGDKCRPGHTNFFPELTYKIPYKRLVQEGYLMPLKGKVSVSEDILTELNGVKLSGGDYVMSAAGEVMGRHVDSAVKAYELHGKHHKKVAVLACTIEHAEQLTEAFANTGYKAAPVHSKMAMADRNKILEQWQYGDVDIVVSVNVLVEGFDFPDLSCLIMCRPTKSPVIWVQAIGRILRKAPGKEESLLIDLTGNVREFGLDLDNPKFIIPKSKKGEGGEAPSKICPGDNEDGTACGAVVYAATLICPDCGYKWDQDEVQQQLGEIEDVDFKQYEPPKWSNVIRVDPAIHTSKANGNQLLRINIVLEGESAYDRNRYVSVWCCFEDYYPDNDYVLEKGKEKWKLFSAEPYPTSVEEAEWYMDSIKEPVKVLCSEDDKGYLNAVDFNFEGTIEDTEDYETIKYYDVPF